MLSQFFSKAALSGRTTTNSMTPGVGGVEPAGTSQNRTHKSVQHFFLNWDLIQSALKAWKDCLEDEKDAERKGLEAASIDKNALGLALRPLDMQFTDQELDWAFLACKHDRERADQVRLRGSVAAAGGQESTTKEAIEDVVTAAAVAAGVAKKAPVLVSLEDMLLTPLPVGFFITRAMGTFEDSDLMQLQEAT